MTAAPRGQAKAAEENAPAPEAEPETDILGGSREEGEALPATPGPNDSTPEGEVDVTVKQTVARQKRSAKAPVVKNDTLIDIDHDRLPIAVTVGDIVVAVKSYAGNAVVEFSLKGWVGEPEFKIRAEDVAGQLEPAIAELRKALRAEGK